jgi:hypothetical protein
MPSWLASSKTRPITVPQEKTGSASTRTVAVASGDTRRPDAGSRAKAVLSCRPGVTDPPTKVSSVTVEVTPGGRVTSSQTTRRPETSGSAAAPSTVPVPVR